MTDGQTTARTLREAFVAGTVLVRSRFWQYAGALFALMVLVLAGYVPTVLAVKYQLWAVAGITAWGWRVITGTFAIGVYRSFWESMGGNPVRAQFLSWGFRKSSRWTLPVIWALFTVPFTVPNAWQILHIGHPSPRWMHLGAIPVILATMLVNYAYALIARYDMGPADAVRTTARIFRKGKRRWFALPVVGALVPFMAAAVISLVMLLTIKTLGPGSGLTALIMVLIFVPIWVAGLVAYFLWMGGAVLASLGAVNK